MGVSAAVAVGVTALATTAYTIDQSQKARKEASDNQQKLQEKQDAQMAEAAQRSKDQEASATAATVRDAARQRQLSQSGMASNSTIMTSPLGTPNINPTGGGGKTLLGT